MVHCIDFKGNELLMSCVGNNKFQQDFLCLAFVRYTKKIRKKNIFLFWFEHKVISCVKLFHDESVC